MTSETIDRALDRVTITQRGKTAERVLLDTCAVIGPGQRRTMAGPAERAVSPQQSGDNLAGRPAPV